MNEYQTTLYDWLMDLVQSNEAFYFSDVDVDDVWYRIFNYRLASYTDFCQPGALECRGITFEMVEPFDPTPVRLASIPFEKFFNLYENPFTMDLDLSTVREIADKADGSLITSYMHKGDLRLKTKGSLTSDQAIAAMGWLYMPEQEEFLKEIVGAERLGYTVIMEWVAPDNRIVLGYETPELRVLGVRSREDGSYVDYRDVDIYVFPQITFRWTKLEPVEDPVEFVKKIPDMQNIEGYVLLLESGQRVKVKTTWYLALHHTKDSINSPRRLFEAVLEEATDDMRSLFHDDKVAIQMIEDMEHFVDEKYNHMVDQVERFYERNKHMTQKDYAILGQKELDRMFFGLAMNKYVGKSVNYKEFLKKQWKKLGLKDREEENESGPTITIDLESHPPMMKDADDNFVVMSDCYLDEDQLKRGEK